MVLAAAPCVVVAVDDDAFDVAAVDDAVGGLGRGYAAAEGAGDTVVVVLGDALPAAWDGCVDAVAFAVVD